MSAQGAFWIVNNFFGSQVSIVFTNVNGMDNPPPHNGQIVPAYSASSPIYIQADSIETTSFTANFTVGEDNFLPIVYVETGSAWWVQNGDQNQTSATFGNAPTITSNIIQEGSGAIDIIIVNINN